MTRPTRVLGFDRTIELSWLDATVGFVAQGLDSADVRKRVFAYLEGVVPGSTNNSARGKTATVLTRIWANVSPRAVGLRDDAVRLYADSTSQTRLALHWALLLAAYPYFADVAMHAGRLLRLHGELQVPQLTRRLSESWGERDLVQRTAQLVTRSMALWGVLRTGPRTGTYLSAGAPLEVSAEAGVLLAEALLLSVGREALASSDVESHPALFPFAMQLEPTELRSAERLEVHRIGLAIDQVSLKATGF